MIVKWVVNHCYIRWPLEPTSIWWMGSCVLGWRDCKCTDLTSVLTVDVETFTAELLVWDIVILWIHDKTFREHTLHSLGIYNMDASQYIHINRPTVWAACFACLASIPFLDLLLPPHLPFPSFHSLPPTLTHSPHHRQAKMSIIHYNTKMLTCCMLVSLQTRFI